MIALIFELIPHPAHRERYLALAAELRERLGEIDGFISIERFQSLNQPDKLLSLSFWRDEQAVAQWRNLECHRQAQALGRDSLFADYRLRVASVLRDYGLQARQQAPLDSQQVHQHHACGKTCTLQPAAQPPIEKRNKHVVRGDAGRKTPQSENRSPRCPVRGRREP
ncbi:hypothetical protein GV819_21840 [Pseudomonas sp. Fl5BN2]|nr:hypothetical protein [Pseudomonas sp. Fl5BN2]NBF09156.1 hypothetical protein [Pseudomonas sp. Fl4BN1]